MRRVVSDVIILDEQTCAVRVGHDRAAIIDRADLPLVSDRRWYLLLGHNGRVSAKANGDGGRADRRGMHMHRVIMDTAAGYETDHINLNALDNRRSNLRVATASQNSANAWKPARSGPWTSQFKGVSWDRERNRWKATIKVGGRQLWLGRFDDEADAARAYDRAALTTWGGYALLNFTDLYQPAAETAEARR